jgi:hypothetical protein
MGETVEHYDEHFWRNGHAVRMIVCRPLICEWSGGTVIRSPGHPKPNQRVTLASSIRSGAGKVLLDLQFYLPYADHERLVSHGFSPTGDSKFCALRSDTRMSQALAIWGQPWTQDKAEKACWRLVSRGR